MRQAEAERLEAVYRMEAEADARAKAEKLAKREADRQYRS